MWGIFTNFLKDRKNMILGFCLGALAFIEMYVALFPTLKNQAEEINKLLEAYPKGFLEAFGFDGTQSMFTQLETYMSTEYFSFFWLIMIAIMAVSFANALCAGEIEKGTIELTLAQPISRSKTLLARFFAGSMSITIFTFISAYGIMLSAIIHNISYNAPNYLTVSIIGSLCGIAIFSMAVFFSTLFSEKGRVAITVTSILLLMYAGNIIASLEDNLDKIKLASFFHYFDAPAVFGKNEIIEWSVLVFSLTIVVFLVAALVRFQKRDIAV